MAEIKIEKRKPIWPWIIAIVLIVAVIYFVYMRDNQTQTVEAVEMENTTAIDSTGIDSTAIDTTAN